MSKEFYHWLAVECNEAQRLVYGLLRVEATNLVNKSQIENSSGIFVSKLEQAINYIRCCALLILSIFFQY
jgi:hypothetical protein